MAAPARGRWVESAAAEVRLAVAREWLAARPPHAPLLVVAASLDAASDLLRARAAAAGALFGAYRFTLAQIAAELARPALAESGQVAVGALPLEALAARVVHRLGDEGGLGRFDEVGRMPGFPRSLARTIAELRLEGVDPERLDPHAPDLARLYRRFRDELGADAMADRAVVFERAIAVAADRRRRHPLLGLPLLLADLAIGSAIEAAFVAALAARSPEVLATAAAGDERTLRSLRTILPAGGPAPEPPGPATSLRRLQSQLFAEAAIEPAALDGGVALFSAPGESRECVEIARRIVHAAEAGTRFDRMAVLLRAPAQYRAHLEEAFRRAAIPAHFAPGTVAPDPSGRAFLALLATAAEDLSARRFAEYLSLGEVADAGADGGPLPPAAAGSFVPAAEELMPRAFVEAAASGADEDEAEAAEATGTVGADDPAAAAVVSGTLAAPRHWERLLVEAAVIGSRQRWERRLAALAEELRTRAAALDDPDGPEGDRLRRDLAGIERLSRYALPLVDDLAALPARASWGEWLERLRALATRALRRPERIHALLAELAPMAAVGPVDLAEVRLVLHRRLTDLVLRPPGRRQGKVFVAACEAARGLVFDLVFVPGLAERLFPQKVAEDPILRDRDRTAIGAGLVTSDDRIAAEKLALRLAVGAASDRVVVSYPRLDVEQSRPRVPSFYGLELLRAAEGKLPGFEDLQRRAEVGGAPRIGWPAPTSPRDAIDEAEHDLALLEPLLRRPEAETVGTARYLLGANPHLARALRFRARRWHPNWHAADGLVKPSPEAAAALAAHQLAARSYSPTALENFAACPYKFALHAIWKLSPRQDPQAIEEMDPLERGSLVHEVQFRLLEQLSREDRLPVTGERLAGAQATLEQVLAAVAGEYRERLAPAIERVWLDAIAAIQADLREWLRRQSEDGTGFVPWHFELAFGPVPGAGRDRASRREPACLDLGLQLRGSIDLVERRADGTLRATDYKTGKVRAEAGAVVGGGQTLQPVFYALALESLFPGSPVDSGRLYYCTSAAGFTERVVPLDDRAREAAAVVVATVGEALAAGFLPAAPREGACLYCDYRVVCGPWEELRTARVKRQEELKPLVRLRSLP